MPFFDGVRFHFNNSPAWLSTRQTLDGLTATMSASSIMKMGAVVVLVSDGHQNASRLPRFQDRTTWLGLAFSK